ncbi:MAG: TetR family transcriptional regulator [Sphingomonas bacterium]|uniref:META domain-containing protein n=1 Tax=Sphingomonas bacterium TaxID=1895847 RepID=UPI00261E9733|nr:META domain-containing protein [Sphingomonas bacterium]MDB5708749.1 TetR family transcriptional regulator [Sphingomonas bacterium]
MKFAIALAAPALMLASAASAQPARETYRASGTMPDWNLQIDRSLIRYVGDRGRTRIIAPAPVARPSFNGMRYVTPRITVDVTYARCIDGRGLAFHDRVTVTYGRRTVRGCGGERLTAPLALNGTRWMIASLDGRPVRTARTSDIRFTDSRVQGNAGCNSFGGAYRLVGDRLSAGQVISTRMACVGPGMNVEGRFFDILADARVERRGAEIIALNGNGGSVELRAVR